MTNSSKLFDEFVMNYHSFFVVQNIDALRFHFQNDFDVHANVWKEFSWRIFFMLNSMFEQKNLKEFQSIMNEYVILHLKKAYSYIKSRTQCWVLRIFLKFHLNQCQRPNSTVDIEIHVFFLQQDLTKNLLISTLTLAK